MTEDQPNTLTPKQENAIIALMSKPSLAKAAAAAGVSEKTLYRWLREPEFTDRYREARREAFGHAIAMTQRHAAAAVATLSKVMADEKAPPAARVQAASTLLRFARQGIELDDLAARVEALESSQEEAP
jgi:hypothetical protein